MSEGISGQINNLKQMSQAELIAKYSELFPVKKAHSKNPEYLRKKIAYNIQEKVLGGLSETAKTKLDQFIQVYDPINNKILRKINGPEELKGKKTRDKRLPIPGTVITKLYKGTLIKVKVLDKGFEYEGSYYRSLSSLAKKISGTHANGYLFFRLQENYGKKPL